MNNTLEGIHSRITEAEQWINDLEDKMVEITAAEQNIEKRMKALIEKRQKFYQRTRRTREQTNRDE